MGAFARVEKGISEDNFFLRGVSSDSPLLRSDEPSIEQFSIEGIELIDESFIDFSTLPARVKVLECFEDVPLISV